MVTEDMSKTGKRFFDLLSDGMFHTQEELHKLLWDPLSEVTTIRFHIAYLRKAIQPHGLDVVHRADNDGAKGYVLMRRLAKRRE